MEKRYKILAATSFSLFCFFFAYDVPAALNTSMIFNGSPATDFHITLLYSFYALPNIIAPYYCGKAMSRLENNTLIILCLFISVGQLLFTYALRIGAFKYAVLGRMLFGIGLESFMVFVDKVLIDCFTGKELALAMGTFKSVGRLGTVTNFLSSPYMEDKYSPTFIYTGSLLLVLLAVLISFSMAFYIEAKYMQEEATEHESDRPGVPFRTFLSIAFLMGCVWAPFYNIAPLMLRKRFSVGKIEAGRMLGCIEGASVFLQSLIGTFVDHNGFKLYLILGSSMLISLAHLNFLIRMTHHYVSIALMMASSPMLACFWPCIPKVVPPSQVSKSLGLTICTINLAFVVSPLIASILVRVDPFYSLTELYCVSIAFLFVFYVYKMIQENIKYDLGLNDPEITPSDQIQTETQPLTNEINQSTSTPEEIIQ